MIVKDSDLTVCHAGWNVYLTADTHDGYFVDIKISLFYVYELILTLKAPGNL